MAEKTCLLIYIGNGFSKKNLSYNREYFYSVDMRDNRENHRKNILQPLENRGYRIDTALVTNKHEFYNGFKKEYNSIDLDYSDLTFEEEENLRNFYHLKIDPSLGWGPGQFKTGGRFLKLKTKLPEYDLYVFLRADASFKIDIDQLKIDYEKINYLWPETDFRFFKLGEDEAEKVIGVKKDWFWQTYHRVNGNVFNVVPKKYINTFLYFYWLEHLSLHFMLENLSPLITVENDINLMCGINNFYVTDVRVCDNPVFTFNKKIINHN